MHRYIFDANTNTKWAETSKQKNKTLKLVSANTNISAQTHTQRVRPNIKTHVCCVLLCRFFFHQLCSTVSIFHFWKCSSCHSNYIVLKIFKFAHSTYKVFLFQRRWWWWFLWMLLFMVLQTWFLNKFSLFMQVFNWSQPTQTNKQTDMPHTYACQIITISRAS